LDWRLNCSQPSHLQENHAAEEKANGKVGSLNQYGDTVSGNDSERAANPKRTTPAW